MSKENIPYNSVPEDNSEEKLAEIHSSEEKDAFIEKIKQVYLPQSAANDSPTEESIEHANGLDSSKPNPLEELIDNKNNNSEF